MGYIDQNHLIGWTLLRILLLWACLFHGLRSPQRRDASMQRNVVEAMDDILVHASGVPSAFVAEPMLDTTMLSEEVLKHLRSVISLMPEALTVEETGLPVLFDTGATKPVTFDRSDFVGDLRRPPCPMIMQGIATGLAIEGTGTIAWHFLDDLGASRTIQAKAYYIPKLKTWLLSPQAYFQEGGGEMLVRGNYCKFQWKDGGEMTIPYHQAS